MENDKEITISNSKKLEMIKDIDQIFEQLVCDERVMMALYSLDLCHYFVGKQIAYDHSRQEIIDYINSL